jgi:Na+-transporting NADH:ubiquinone oxidoreductase subunit NqrB
MDYSNLSVYILAGLTAACFGLIAYKLQKGVVLWFIGGAVLALSVGGISLGLAHAAILPYTPSELHRMKWIGTTVAAFLIGITGAILTVANRRPASTPGPTAPLRQLEQLPKVASR